ncbi:hypothetical protein CXT95_02705 [Akkermansia muciniphila]|uniref:Uncharacterized protein n=1 Tax=Akkermansia muciniphila TaxID=239935 RepID=A0AAX0WKF9_9BACT|nr:hypothetical protein CXT95_02705 [Akkermansia muciniphila]
MFLTKLLCPSVPESSASPTLIVTEVLPWMVVPEVWLAVHALPPVMKFWAVTLPKSPRLTVALLLCWMLVTRTLVFPVMVVTALWEEVLPPMMAPATMALSLTVTLVFPVRVVLAPLLFPPMTCSAVAFPESCTWVSPVSVLVWRLVPHSLVTPPAMMPNAPPLMSIQMSPW